ncbi:unnamed protein product [Amoebophrya sp. A25]|nr:unnamed protein product [Amoebophrya sp. A25]|eukprot:GSA25T00022067001.1
MKMYHQHPSSGVRPQYSAAAHNGHNLPHNGHMMSISRDPGQKRLPNPVIVANEAIGYVSMCNDTRWRSYTQEELLQRVQDQRLKFVGKDFVIGHVDNLGTNATEDGQLGKRVHVSKVDGNTFYCEMHNANPNCSDRSDWSSSSDTAKLNFAPAARVPQYTASPEQGAKYRAKDSDRDWDTRSGASSSSMDTKSRSPKRLSTAQRLARGGTNSTAAGTGTDTSMSDNEFDFNNGIQTVKLEIENLVPVGSLRGDEQQHMLALRNGGMVPAQGGGPMLWSKQFSIGQWENSSTRSASWNGNLTFDRIERKVAQAIFFFKGNPPPNAKDQTIFNRELWQNLSQRYRADELHRLDILELLLKAKKCSFLNVKCKDLCIWEDEEKILKLDAINIDTNAKRLRIKNPDAARQKHRLREQNVLYASALSVVRPACVGTGMVNFGQFDWSLARDVKYENQLYTRFVKFVKYGMCERCQAYYLERGQQQQQRTAAQGQLYYNKQQS